MNKQLSLFSFGLPCLLIVLKSKTLILVLELDEFQSSSHTQQFFNQNGCVFLHLKSDFKKKDHLNKSKLLVSSLVLSPTNLGHVFQCCLQFQHVSFIHAFLKIQKIQKNILITKIKLFFECMMQEKVFWCYLFSPLFKNQCCFWPSSGSGEFQNLSSQPHLD